MSSQAPPPELRARVLEAIARDPMPPRGASAWKRARPLLLGFGLLLALFALAGVHLGRRPVGYVVAVLLAWLPIAVLATWAGVSRGGSMLGRPRAWLLGVVAVTPAAMMVVWSAVALAWPSALDNTTTAGQHVLCDVVSIVLSLGPLFAFAALRRGSDPVSPRLTGAAIATAAAAWAAIAHELMCMFSSPFHILVGHVAPVLGVALLGAAFAARTVAVRAKTG